MVNNTLPTLEIGTHYPNRIFVGSLPGSANASDLAEFFKEFGTVLEGKVVLDINGNSRRFGFVTFATNEDVKRVLSQGVIFFRGKQVNVGPAVKRLMPESHPGAMFAASKVSVASPLQRNAPPICNMKHIAEPLTPPVSPVSPVCGQSVFINMGQFSPKTVMPSVHVSPSPPTYIVACNGIPMHANYTNIHLPCQSIPLSPTSGILPRTGPMQHCFKTVNLGYR